MEDLISRQDAIDALGDAPEVWTESPEELAEVSQWEMDVAAIMAVPSADWDLPSIQAEHYAQGFADGYKRGMKDADRPSGEWIRWKEQDKEDLANGNALYECSICGHTDLHAETLEVPYCWYCGAAMRGEQDENR